MIVARFRKDRQERGMTEETTLRLTQALGVAAGLHEARRRELVEHLAAVGGDYDLHALDAAREAAYRYVVAASELRGFRWALRQVLDEEEIVAMAREASTHWEEFLAMREDGPAPLNRPSDDDHHEQ
jgi:hypothetical protein